MLQNPSVEKADIESDASTCANENKRMVFAATLVIQQDIFPFFPGRIDRYIIPMQNGRHNLVLQYKCCCRQSKSRTTVKLSSQMFIVQWGGRRYHTRQCSIDGIAIRIAIVT